MELALFFNSNNGDRVYDATQFASFFAQLVSDGIFYNTASNLQVTVSSGMTVSVAAGSCFIRGYCYQNTTTLSMTLTTANGSNPRIDRIVVRWSLVNRNIKLAIITGAASATPTAPALTRTNDTYELCLASILIPKSSVSVTTANITDTRLDSSVCGLANSLITAVYE